jgi:hypothetical protein
VRTALSPHINHGQPDAILLVEFSGASKADRCCRSCAHWWN